MKKLSALFLIFALLLVAVPYTGVTVTAEESAPTVTSNASVTEIPADATTVTVGSETYTVVRQASDLPTVGVENGRYILANDLDLGGQVYASDYAFVLGAGSILNGNGYCMKNFSLTRSGEIGLFSLGENVEIKNLSVGTENAPIAVSGTGYVGVLAGRATKLTQSMTFENVHIWADIQATDGAVGGFVAGAYSLERMTFTDCSFHGSIKVTTSKQNGIAGFVGYPGKNLTFERSHNFATINVTGTSSNCRAGGLFGQWAQIKTATVADCNNYGNVSSCADYVGGLIPGFEASAQTVTITRARNYGNIEGTNATNVGGIVGKVTMNADGGSFTLTDCVNYGGVMGKKNVGGILGNSNGVTKVAFAVSGCQNYGAISTIESDAAAGIVGRINNSDTTSVFSNCMNAGGIVGGNIAAMLGTNNGTHTLKVNGFLNTGKIMSSSRAGSICSYNGGSGDIELENCVNLGVITAGGDCGGLLADASAEKSTVIRNCLVAGSVSTTAGSLGILIGGKNAAKATCSGIFYMESDGADKTGAADGTKLADWSAVVDRLNESYSSVWGSFLLNTDGTGAVAATPCFAGVQDGAVQNGIFSVRFVGMLQDTLRYGEVGFKVSVNGGSVKTISCKNVYLKLLATDNGEQTEMTAAELGGSYIFALSVADIPAAGTVTFTVTTYATDQTTSANRRTYNGTTYTVTYVDGVFNSISTAANG